MPLVFVRDTGAQASSVPHGEALGPALLCLLLLDIIILHEDSKRLLIREAKKKTHRLALSLLEIRLQIRKATASYIIRQPTTSSAVRTMQNLAPSAATDARALRKAVSAALVLPYT